MKKIALTMLMYTSLAYCTEELPPVPLTAFPLSFSWINPEKTIAASGLPFNMDHTLTLKAQKIKTIITLTEEPLNPNILDSDTTYITRVR